jgi:hypothetical protein
MSEVVYLLTNPTIPDLVKIGRTTDLEQRMRQLSTHSGVAVPFECFYACTVNDGVAVEKALHEAFGDHRINPKREFFRISPSRIQAILRLFEVNDETPTTEIVEDQQELEALHREQARQGRFRFDLVAIPPGSTLVFLKDESIVARVVDNQKIEFEGEITSTSNAARKVLHRMGYNWKQVRGPSYWTYEGETLEERRSRLESSGDEDSA